MRPQRDPASGAEHFAYTQGGAAHAVWLSDAATVRGQVAVSQSGGARAVALWRLGTEDPDVWGGAKP